MVFLGDIMRNRLEQLNENLLQYPVARDMQNQTVVIGDLHGNAMKLIYLLLRFGIINMNPDRYQRLMTLYNTPVNDLTLELLDEFEAIVNASTIRTFPDLLVLIGDEFADRGQNDYFTALVFKKMHDSGVPYKIHLSNHGASLIGYLENPLRPLVKFREGQENSLDNLRTLVSKFEQLKVKFSSLVEHAYKDHLALIGYIQTVGQPLSVLTHAPIDNVIMKGLSKTFSVDYHSETADNIVECIDKINAAISTSIKENRFTIDYSSSTSSFVYQPLWNREAPKEYLPNTIINIHGHVGPKASPSNRYINLDTHWGKPSEIGYDSEGNQGIIPAEDEGVCPIVRRETSPMDKDSAYYQSPLNRGATLMAFDEVSPITVAVTDDLVDIHALLDVGHNNQVGKDFKRKYSEISNDEQKEQEPIVKRTP